MTADPHSIENESIEDEQGDSAPRPLPLNVAHRGASFEAPENTLAAFRRAIEQRAVMIELDVQLSLDGYPVVIHDDTLDRTTTGRGAVADKDLATLRSFDAGSWKDVRYVGERIPTLQEVIDLCKASGTWIDIEMKFSRRQAWHALCDAVGALVEKRGFRDQCFVSSFNHRALHYLKLRFPNISIARLYATHAPRERNLRFDPRPQAAVYRLLVVPSLVKRLHRLNGKLHVWTVDDPDEMRRMIRMGVDSIVTNKPALLQSILDENASK